MMPETFAERKEQWEGIVPDHLRSALLFRQEPKKRRSKLDKDEAIAVEEFVPDGLLWDWATSDPRRLATLYELAQQLRAQWCETRGTGSPDRFSLMSPIRLTLRARPLSWATYNGSWNVRIHDFPGVYGYLFQLLGRKTATQASYLGNHRLSKKLKQLVELHGIFNYEEPDLAHTFELGHLEEFSRATSAWNAMASDPAARRQMPDRDLREIGPQPDVFSTFISLHGLMVRQIGVPGVHTSHSDYDHQTHGSMHRSDGTFEIALTFNSNDFQPPKEQP